MDENEIINYRVRSSDDNYQTVHQGFHIWQITENHGDTGMAEKTIIDIVKKYKETLNTRFDISGIYLFGSHTKASFTEDSDIDVAVIVNSEFSYEDELELMRRRRSIDLRIEPHIFTVSDFQEWNPLAAEIKRTGILI